MAYAPHRSQEEHEILAKFADRDKRWPLCKCFHSAQSHPHTPGEYGTIEEPKGCPCTEYRPIAPLTPLQLELVNAQKKHPHLNRLKSLEDERRSAHAEQDAVRLTALMTATKGMLAVTYPKNCIHDAEPSYCDSCRVMWERHLGMAREQLRAAFVAMGGEPL